MFNLNDGSLTIDKYQININRYFTYQDFSKSKLYEIAKPIIINYPYRSYDINSPVLFLGELFSVRLFFNNEKLERLHICLYETDNASSWENWSEEAEMTKLTVQDDLLTKNIGSPPYIFEWGSIESLFDKRSGDTGIVITYK